MELRLDVQSSLRGCKMKLTGKRGIETGDLCHTALTQHVDPLVI